MAKRKGYVEPTDYLPPEVRKIFETDSKPKATKPKTAEKKQTTKKK